MKLSAVSLLLTISSLSLLSSPAAAKPQHESSMQHEGTTRIDGTTQHETPATAQDTSAEEKIAAGEHDRRHGNYPQALRQIKLGLSQIQNSKNPSPERLAAAYNYLALLNNSMGQYADSEQNARRALSLGRQAKLSENILARHRVVLANALRQQGKYPEAQSNLEKAIATVKTSNGDKELFATATNNLGALYFWMGSYQQAITILKRGLALRLAIAAGDKENLDKENLDKENLDIANSYLDLGCTEFKLGQNAKAREHLSLALEIRKNKLGDDHPETLNAMANLAALLDAREAEPDSQKSLNLLQQVVKSGGKKLAADHPDLIRYQQEYAEALTNQASRLSTKGQQQQALEAIQQAIKLRETTSKTIGHKDISYAITLTNAAAILKRLDQPLQSKSMLIKAKAVLDGLPKSVQQSPEGKAIRKAYYSSNSNIKDH